MICTPCIVDNVPLYFDLIMLYNAICKLVEQRILKMEESVANECKKFQKGK